MQSNATELESALVKAQKDEQSEREQHIAAELGVADLAHTISTDQRLDVSYTRAISTLHAHVASLKLVSSGACVRVAYDYVRVHRPNTQVSEERE